ARTEDGRLALYKPAEIKKSGDTALINLAAHEHSRPLHPAQLYTTLTAFLLAALLVAYYTLPHTPGTVFAMMMVLEGIARFVQELLRVEPPVMHVGNLGLSLSMVLGIGLAIFGAVLGFVFTRIGGTTKHEPGLAA